MKKYLIELMKYSEAGVPTSEYTYDYADTPQELADKVKMFNGMKHANDAKMYRVVPKQAVYAQIEDFDQFVAVNGLEYKA